MAWFGYGREGGFPTQYSEIRSPVTADVLEAGFILAFVILAVSFSIVIFGSYGKSKFYLFVKVIVNLLIGLLLMLGNIGQEWETANIKATTPYRAGVATEINADIGIKVGLRSVNVTLKNIGALPRELKSEEINYNERFSWTWDQGQFGFGPYSGLLQQEFREAQHKGTPLPILWIVDYLVVDGEGLRFGRFYRTAGWYSHILLWTAFSCWLLANLMFLNVIQYGAILTGMTGILQLSACLVWGVVRNANSLVIPFEYEEKTVYLKPSFGSSFWITIASGILCVAIGTVVFIFDILYPESVAVFFGIDPLADYFESRLTETETEVLLRGNARSKDEMEMGNTNSLISSDSNARQNVTVLKRRTTMIPQRSVYRNQMFVEEEDYADVEPSRSRSPESEVSVAVVPPPVDRRKKRRVRH